MYGEGDDWTPLYSVRSGQMAGALPVGIETKGFSDVPYWPNQICWTYKEVWTLSTGRWIWLMQDLAGPAVVTGAADSISRKPVEFREEKTGAVRTVTLGAGDSTFRIELSEGKYRLRQGALESELTALPGGTTMLTCGRSIG